MSAEETVIIFTQTADVHACAVDYVLRCLGERPALVNTDEILREKPISVKFSDAGEARLQLGDFRADLNSVISSWNRRISANYSLPAGALKEDEAFVRKNAESYLKGFISLLDDRFPVNPSGALFASANKMRQLRWAKLCGLLVPDTLISNKASEILEFLDSHVDVCVKPYVGHHWRTDDGVVVSNNSRIGRDTIENPDDLEVMPHIYQSFINKKAEYRLTIFGGYHVATRICTNKLSGGSAVDWRASMDYLRHLEPASLDDRLVEACSALLRKLGLRFGTFDLAEDEDSNFYFLEVNQAGQWLWQELHCPDCVLLEPFARYLASADDRFAWDKSRAGPALAAANVLKAVQASALYKDILAAEIPSDEAFFTDERAPAESGKGA